MATVNRTGRTAAATVTLNHEGTVVKRLNAYQQLRRAVLSCLLWEDDFYEDGKSVADRIKELVTVVEPEKVAAVAKEARGKFKLRHVPLLLARELARGTKQARLVVADLLFDIIQRPDELTEFLAIYWKEKRQPLSAQVKKGLARAFGKFGAYSFAKYNRDGAVKLRDVMFLSHPDPRNCYDPYPECGNGKFKEEVFKKLADKTLESADTWEVNLSAGKDKAETFTRLIKEKKLGALAVLRNLRNMVEAKVDENIIVDALDNMDTERVLPFRFITAAKYAPTLEAAIERAMFRCLDGMEKLTGRTALVVDTSPSMWMANVSSKSEMNRFEAAAALAILLREICSDVRIFAFNKQSYDVPARRGFALRDAIAQTKEGYSCGGYAVDAANKWGYDRIIVLTDGEWHYSHLQERAGDCKVVSPAPLTDKAYMVNVSTTKNGVGYGKWTSIDGWSEAIVEFIQQSETVVG
jgi:60 kDa SS-A/Ro ribonucleoprotein